MHRECNHYENQYGNNKIHGRQEVKTYRLQIRGVKGKSTSLFIKFHS